MKHKMINLPASGVMALFLVTAAVFTSKVDAPQIAPNTAGATQYDRYEPLPAATTTTTTTTMPAYGDCEAYLQIALSVGWPPPLLDKLGKVLKRESRCQYDAYNPDDVAGGSYGAAQINGYWCSPSKYWPEGWLQTQGVLNTCIDLYNPATNMRAALAIYNYSNSWRAWYTK